MMSVIVHNTVKLKNSKSELIKLESNKSDMGDEENPNSLSPSSPQKDKDIIDNGHN